MNLQGDQLFSDVLVDNKFNMGLDDFDIVVNQWDNFGRFIDKSGDLIQFSALHIGSVARFKLSGFYSKYMHGLQFFDGVAPPGIHVYSFAMKPNDI